MNTLTKFKSAVDKIVKLKPFPLVIDTDSKQTFIAELRPDGLLICETLPDPEVEAEQRTQFEATNGVVIPFEHIQELINWLTALTKE
jgi:hypothetical protein